jgi:hypothetical protein
MNQKGFGPKVYDWWTCPDPDHPPDVIYYIMMERMSSRVDIRVHPHNYLMEKDVDEMMAEAKRLDDAHIVHGDMRVQNMMRNQAGRVVTVDFGFTKVFDGSIVMSFTDFHNMGWLTDSQNIYVLSPHRYVPHINQLQLMCDLWLHYNINPYQRFPHALPSDFPPVHQDHYFQDQVRDYIYRHGWIGSCGHVAWWKRLFVRPRPRVCLHTKPLQDLNHCTVLLTRVYPVAMRRAPECLILYDAKPIQKESWESRWQAVLNHERSWSDVQLSVHWCTQEVDPDFVPLLNSQKASIEWIRQKDATPAQRKQMRHSPPESHVDYWIHHG